MQGSDVGDKVKMRVIAKECIRLRELLRKDAHLTQAASETVRQLKKQLEEEKCATAAITRQLGSIKPITSEEADMDHDQHRMEALERECEVTRSRAESLTNENLRLKHNTKYLQASLDAAVSTIEMYSDPPSPQTRPSRRRSFRRSSLRTRAGSLPANLVLPASPAGTDGKGGGASRRSRSTTSSGGSGGGGGGHSVGRSMSITGALRSIRFSSLGDVWAPKPVLSDVIDPETVVLSAYLSKTDSKKRFYPKLQDQRWFVLTFSALYWYKTREDEKARPPHNSLWLADYRIAPYTSKSAVCLEPREQFDSEGRLRKSYRLHRAQGMLEWQGAFQEIYELIDA